MKPYIQAGPSVLVIFGAGGDLAWRKLVPAMYNLFLENWLPDRICIVGIGRREMSEADFRRHMREGVDTFSRRGKTTQATWEQFEPKLNYINADFSIPDAFAAIKARLDELDRDWGAPASRMYYLAIPPLGIETVVNQIAAAGMAADRERSRIVVEKPFGHDLASAKALNRTLTTHFDESQVYRIDHYLGKETVQNILAFRFANSLFEPIWNRRYIDHVQITVGERVGVEHRGGYYEQAGALRDMVQNHLSQVLCLIAMEPPVSYQADEIRNKKVDVLRAIRQILPDQVHNFAVRGQYDAGWIEGQHVPAYRQEPGVPPDSNTETFAAVKYFVDNWRWQDVPFYMRTGKRLPSRASEVIIQFRPVPHESFPSRVLAEAQPNRLVIRIQPKEGILLKFQAKYPGSIMRLKQVDMRFTYEEAFHTEPPEAYETLLLDVLLGDPTQFMRADQLEAAWAVIEPILQVWQSVTPSDFPNYPAGTWGPQAGDVLIARDGRNWLLPTANGDDHDEGS